MPTGSKQEFEPPRTPSGYRAYAIGDIHGRLDLLDRLLAAIERDVERRPKRNSLLIFLGDLIDRGPDSRGVVERLKTYRHDRLELHFLMGNHEEVLLRLLDGERGILASWLTFGGSECLQSYGLDPAPLRRMGEAAALPLIATVIPTEHVRFIQGFADTLSFGDYLFVHAGIRPGLDLSTQRQADLRWIRSPFLEDDRDHGFIVVHGHSISDAVEMRRNRIGIDTGAYRSGILTALRLEDDQYWIIDTADNNSEMAGTGSESG
jgi:serine/threonine protein phosphatase 1